MFEAEERSLIVLVDWVGFDVDERTCEPFKEIFEAAPEFLAKELRKLRRRAIIGDFAHGGRAVVSRNQPGPIFTPCLLYTSPSPRD